jgi:hypothetical protein
VEYALALALLVVACIGSLQYLEDETGEEVDNQAECISTRPPPPSCQIPAAAPAPDPSNPSGVSGDPGSGSPATAVANISTPVVGPQAPTPSGTYDIDVTVNLTDDTAAPIQGQIVTAQVVVTQATSATRVGDFFYVDCTTADDGSCTFSFDSRWGTVDEVRFEIKSIGIDTPYQFTAPAPVLIGRPT